MRFILKLSLSFFLLIFNLSLYAGTAPETTERFNARVAINNLDPNLPRAGLTLYPGIKLYSLGYVQGDFMTFGNPILKDSANWRAARALWILSFEKKFDFVFGYNFATHAYNQLLISVNKDDLTIDFGQIFPVFALLNSIATPYFSFLEVPLPAYTFKPGYHVGSQWTYHHRPFNISVGVYRPKFDYPRPGENSTGVINFVYVPFDTEGHVLLFNSAAQMTGVSSNPTLAPVSFSAPPLTLPYDQTTLISATVPSSRNYIISANEVATTQGSLTCIVDYTHTWVNRVAGFPQINFYGYFITLNYFLTGEVRLFSFNNASYLAFSKIRHKYGAIAISLIYDYLNLTSGDIAGGREMDYGISLNWYPASHMDFRLQYVHALARPGDLGVNQTANIVALRIEVMW